MIYGVGVDVLQVQRLAGMQARHGDRLFKMLLTRQEQTAHASRKRHRLRRLAEAVAVKEAFVKALGTGFDGVSHRDCGLVKGKGGRPELVFSRSMQTRLRALGISGSRVSLGTAADVVCATVILESAG